MAERPQHKTLEQTFPEHTRYITPRQAKTLEFKWGLADQIRTVVFICINASHSPNQTVALKYLYPAIESGGERYLCVSHEVSEEPGMLESRWPQRIAPDALLMGLTEVFGESGAKDAMEKLVAGEPLIIKIANESIG